MKSCDGQRDEQRKEGWISSYDEDEPTFDLGGRVELVSTTHVPHTFARLNGTVEDTRVLIHEC